MGAVPIVLVSVLPARKQLTILTPYPARQLLLAVSDVTLIHNHHNFKSSKHNLYQCVIDGVNTVPSVSVARPLLYFSVSISYSTSFAAQLIRILT